MTDKLNPETIETQYCPNCGKSIKKDAKFCKNCGKTLGETKRNIIERLNNQINLLAVTIGFTVSIIFLILGSLLYGFLFSGSYIDLTTYVGLIIITMIFFGGVAIGLIGCKDYSDAKINGGFFTLIFINIAGLVGGFSFSSAIIMANIISQIFPFSSSDYGSSSLYSSDYGNNSLSTQGTDFNFDSSLFYVKAIIFLVLILVSGIAGSYCGVFLKKTLKNR